MPKQSKWFVVATEGATTDGRNIERAWLEQAAESYDPKNTYGARINLEHIKFTLLWKDEPHSNCFGDVLALKTQERDDGKLQLLAQISPTEGLIELNKERQKIYTSVELDLNFADSGKAYLVGLAVTDNPASLGTEMLQFSQNGLGTRKLKPENLFSAAIETVLEFEDQTEKAHFAVFEKIKALFSKKENADDKQFADHAQALLLLGEQAEKSQEKLTALSEELEAVKAQNADFASRIAEMEAKFTALEQQHNAQYSQRPLVTGSENQDYVY